MNSKPTYEELENQIAEFKKQNEILRLRSSIQNEKEGEYYYSKILNNIGDPVFVKDDQSRLLIVNDSFCEIFGLSRDKIIGKTLAEDVPVEERESFLKIDKQVISDGIENINEESLTVRGGQTRIVSTKKSRFIDSNGDKFLVGIIRDISDRKKAEIALQESEEKYRGVIENMMDGFYKADANGMITLISPSVTKILGFSKEDIIGKPVASFYANPDERNLALEIIKETGRVENYPLEFIRKRKSNIDIEANAQVVYKDGEYDGIEGVFRNITDRKLAEQALQESEEKYSSLFNFSVEGIAIHKMIYNENGEYIDYEITDVNSAFERITGLKREDSIGKKATSLYKVKVAPFIDKYNKVAESGEPISFEIDFEPMGKSFNISVFSYVKGEFITFFSDITVRKEADRKLIESEDKLSKTLIAANDGTWDWNLVTDEVYFDSQYYKMAGYEVNEFPQELQEFQKRIHPEDVEYVFTQVQKHLKGETDQFQVEFRFQKKNGSWLWIMGRGLIVEQDKNNKPLRFIGTHRDITKLKQTEDALIASKEKFHTIADFAYDWEYWINPKDEFIYISPSCERITGYSPNEFKQNPELLTSIVHPDDVYNWKNHKHKVFDKADIETVEFRIITKNGKECWIGHVCQTIYNDCGVNIGIRGGNRDITENKVVELALKESKQKFESMILNSPDLIMSQNTNGKLEYISPQCEEILGYTAEEIMNIDLSKLVHPDDIEKTTKTELTTLGGVELNSFEYRFFKKNGDVVWLDHTARPIIVDGKITEILSTVRDITKLKLDTETLKESEQKLKIANGTKDKFFSIIAHDLKSPFNSMLGFSEILYESFDEYSSEEKKRFIRIIYDGLQNTLKLLENLLQWSLSQMGAINFNPEKINLYLKAKEICDLLMQSAENKSIKLINQSALNIYVDADIDMLATIIRNLLSNAIKYTHKYGKITIKTFLVPDENNIQYVGISVSDTGVGIPKEIQSKLFEIGENTSMKGTDNEKGTGLGLILCKEFVEKHGGKIWLESEIDKGSTFYFTIPGK